MKGSTSTIASMAPEELQVTMIKKTKDAYSQQIKMKLPSDTSFGCILEFMVEQGLLKSRNAIVRPSHNENYIINEDRKIIECYNLIKLRFIVEQVKESRDQIKKKMGNIQALRDKDTYQTDEKEGNSICGKQQCLIM